MPVYNGSLLMTESVGNWTRIEGPEVSRSKNFEGWSDERVAVVP
jgi:hypothetical protein